MTEIEKVSYFTTPYTVLRSCEQNCLQIERLDHDCRVLLLQQVRNRQRFVPFHLFFLFPLIKFLLFTFLQHRSSIPVPRGLRCISASGRLLRLWVRIPPGAWMYVCFECCVLPGTGLCDELITHPEESYRLWCVVVCDLETSWMRRPWPNGGCCTRKEQTASVIWWKPTIASYLHFRLSVC
jgi:hypothetical protein